MTWITLLTTSYRWQAELMEQILIAHDIPTRIIDLGVASYLGTASTTALQVPNHNEWTARLLLSAVEEEPGT
ncbi:DUF2007 domain-containing protein [Calothrix sp. 336/3]|uniref:DUF2007 domain-containing protein n=1 Tax=Calothrix sp. 336/3 TaxID=1337936 RepID=UPI0004E4209B|nr:DUF2007 domain-containing protein [Calothrix sp. 336/3]AKG23087.1 hypothetical protein IJ00_19050 [Calothrix sp. 336/3]